MRTAASQESCRMSVSHLLYEVNSGTRASPRTVVDGCGQLVVRRPGCSRVCIRGSPFICRFTPPVGTLIHPLRRSTRCDTTSFLPLTTAELACVPSRSLCWFALLPCPDLASDAVYASPSAKKTWSSNIALWSSLSVKRPGGQGGRWQATCL